MKKYFYQQGSQKLINLIVLTFIMCLLVLSLIYFLPNLFSFSKKSAVIGEGIKERNQSELSVINSDAEVIPAIEQEDAFQAVMPTDIVVPEVGTLLSGENNADIAIPGMVVNSAPGVSAKFRSFQIKAENGAFMPNQVIVNVGDTVHLDFQAVDGDYDLVLPGYNMKQTAKKGEKKILEFQALQAGNFIYYCSACGGPEQGPRGNIIIVP